MILRVRLQNYSSFGEMQTAPLEPITVIVGANNSGKTNFLHFVDFMRTRGGGFKQFFHRPPTGEKDLRIEWDGTLPMLVGDVPAKPREATYALHVMRNERDELTLRETIVEGQREIYTHGGQLGRNEQLRHKGTLLGEKSVGIHADTIPRTHGQLPGISDVDALMAPVLGARHVHLAVDTLRNDSQLASMPSIGANGSELAALFAHWLLENPERVEEFNSIFTRSLPEMKRVLARCVHPGMVRLFFEQKDGERFDSTQVSDGVLVFAGLVAHALQAPPRTLVLMEEPERAIHPRRLAALIDLLRTLVQVRQTQFIMATHSPTLLNEFRDEPDAVLTFRRGPRGTVIRRLSDMKELEETLSRADPGELLANGFFNEEEPITTITPTTSDD